MLGVNALEDAGVRVMFIMKTKADKRWPTRREMLHRIKNKLDEMGIQITIPHRVVFQDQQNPQPQEGTKTCMCTDSHGTTSERRWISLLELPT